MNDQHAEDIWQRHSAQEIMREARKRFRREIDNEPADHPLSRIWETGAYVKLASTHYSLVKRYLAPAPVWKRHLAVWHMWRATVLAREAHGKGVSNFDQIDVVSRILSKAPRWLGGDPVTATALLAQALGYIPGSESGEMQPHTRALMLVSLAEVEMLLGNTPTDVRRHYDNALAEMPNIVDEKQGCRVLISVGFYLMDHGQGESEKDYGLDLLYWAKNLSATVARDQYDKLHEEFERRCLEWCE